MSKVQLLKGCKKILGGVSNVMLVTTQVHPEIQNWIKDSNLVGWKSW
jgi:hypothetical protein